MIAEQGKAEQWWTKLAEWLALTMKTSGVRRFAIELNAKGKYDFVVEPVLPAQEKKVGP